MAKEVSEENSSQSENALDELEFTEDVLQGLSSMDDD